MAVESRSSLLPPSILLRHESDDEESFVVLGHSLSPECTDEINNGLADSAEANVVYDATKINNSLERMNNSIGSSLFMHHFNPNLSIQAHDETLNTAATNSSVDLSPDEIQQKVDMLVEENLKLKDTLHQNNLAMKKQYDTLVLWQNDVMSVHKSHKEKFAETKVYIEKLKMEKTELVNMIELKNSEIVELKEELKSVNRLNSNAKQISQSSFDNLKIFELESARNNIIDLQQQLESEKSKLLNEVSAKEASQQEVTEIRAEIMQIKSHNEKMLNKQKRESESLQKILLDEIKTLKETIDKNDQEKIEEQLMAAQMHITELQLSNKRDKEIINANELNIQKLNKEIEELKYNNELLNIQLDTYKNDFKEEQQAKINIGVEKTRIDHELCDLYEKNQQLVEEIEQLRKHGYIYVGGEDAAAAATTTATAQPQQTFLCPKCSRKYPNISSLEHHIITCIPIDNLF